MVRFPAVPRINDHDCIQRNLRLLGVRPRTGMPAPDGSVRPTRNWRPPRAPSQVCAGCVEGVPGLDLQATRRRRVDACRPPGGCVPPPDPLPGQQDKRDVNRVGRDRDRELASCSEAAGCGSRIQVTDFPYIGARRVGSSKWNAIFLQRRSVFNYRQLCMYIRGCLFRFSGPTGDTVF